MSEQVQSIVEAARGLEPSQRRELIAALTVIESSITPTADRTRLVASIRGKYRHVPTSSESFINRKKEDSLLESQP